MYFKFYNNFHVVYFCRIRFVCKRNIRILKQNPTFAHKKKKTTKNPCACNKIVFLISRRLYGAFFVVFVVGNLGMDTRIRLKSFPYILFPRKQNVCGGRKKTSETIYTTTLSYCYTRRKLFNDFDFIIIKINSFISIARHKDLGFYRKTQLLSNHRLYIHMFSFWLVNKCKIMFS